MILFALTLKLLVWAAIGAVSVETLGRPTRRHSNL